MRHFREPEVHCPSRFYWRTFTDIVTIQFEGPKGFGADMDFEVEFRAYPDSVDPDSGVGFDGDREFVSISGIRRELQNGKLAIVERFAIPDMMARYLRDCVDLDALEVDWSDEF